MTGERRLALLSDHHMVEGERNTHPRSGSEFDVPGITDYQCAADDQPWPCDVAILAALPQPATEPALDVEAARLQVHIDQQLNDGLCKPGEDHRAAGPCHRIVDIVLRASQPSANE